MRSLLAPLRAAFIPGLVAAAATWLGFLLGGGAQGTQSGGTLLAAAFFLIEAVLYAYAGFSALRMGFSHAQGAVAGALAGLLSELLAGFWRTAILFLNPAYMAWIQNAQPGGSILNQMPWPPFTVMAALIGTLVAGAAVGAAAGAIGATFFASPERAQS